MKTASIIIIPSLWEEPFGLVAAEAMSNGVAIIASKVGGLTEIVKNNGVLIENINFKKLLEALKELIENKNKRKRYQNKSWKNFNLTSENSSAKLDDIRRMIINDFYKKILEN